MNKFSRWFLRKICKEFVCRGYHKFFISYYFKVMIDESRARFTEDNKSAFESYMRECFDEALNPDQFKYDA